MGCHAESMFAMAKSSLHGLGCGLLSMLLAMQSHYMLCCAVQATLEAAQEAMTTQAEAMRQVTAERDLLRARLSPQSQPLARSMTASVDSNGWIAAAYGTDSRPARPSSGGQPPLTQDDSPLRHF